ncbi:MAG: Uma2 family endonuclease [Planctomycetota bacterium]|nr:Uma2 family endonuclease [Planctomycetota bacterium]
MPELTTAKSVLLTDLALCVNRYRLFTPGIYVCLHVPVVLDANTRIVPGLIAMVNHGILKQCEPVTLGFEGPPNFVLDVFDSNEMAEYESRRIAFERFGVTEYVAVENSECPQLHWNRHDGSCFEEAIPDRNGVIKSKALPGLWIPVRALAARDWWSILSAIERGVTRQGHHEFQESIWHKDGRSMYDNSIPFEAG